VPDFLSQVKSDFEAICGGDFSEEVTVSDGTDTVSLRGLFDASYEVFDPDTNSRVIHEQPRITLAETATPYNLRRNLTFTVRGKTYRNRDKDWEFDGLGQLVIYLKP